MTRDAPASEPDAPGPSGGAALPLAWTVGLAAAFVVVSLGIVWPILDAEFVSDDHLYIVNNHFVHGLTLENVLAILHPYGAPTIYTLNYAPVHLLLVALQWEWVGDATRLYHVSNAVAHAGTTLLLIPFFLRAGLPAPAAVLGAAWFLVHPANVETVAWIFQLKTIVALALSIGALLLHERRPAWAALLFALALLTKVTALGVLPVVALQSWIRSRREPAAAPHWGWIGVWVGVAVLVSVPEMAAFQRQSDPRLLIHEDLWVHGRTIFAIAARYLWMALTGLGVSTFHEPPAAESWLDPWWLAGLVALVAIGVRTVQTLIRGDEEACMWLFAAAAFGPVSQVFPFVFPMGDRYLYPILPGLIGAVLLALRPAWRAAGDALEARGAGSLLSRGAAALALVWIALFAVQSVQRAPVFSSNRTMMVDAALHYPDGMQAHLLRGHRAAAEGNVRAASAAFRRAIDLGFSDLGLLLTHPDTARIRNTPEFAAVLRHLARLDVQRLGAHPDPDASELIALGIAYEVLGRIDQAMASFEAAAAQPGPLRESARGHVERLERFRR